MSAPVPLPNRALLEKPLTPDCDLPAFAFGDTWLDAGAAAGGADYERECYRRAERIVRARLEQLQASVARTVKAIKRSNGP
jgi:hypothetical protein